MTQSAASFIHYSINSQEKLLPWTRVAAYSAPLRKNATAIIGSGAPGGMSEGAASMPLPNRFAIRRLRRTAASVPPCRPSAGTRPSLPPASPSLSPPRRRTWLRRRRGGRTSCPAPEGAHQDGESVQADEALGVGVVVELARFEAGDARVVQRIRGGDARGRNRALVELHADLAGHGLLGDVHEGGEGVAQGDQRPP